MLLHQYTHSCSLCVTNQLFLDITQFCTKFSKRLFSCLASTVSSILPPGIWFNFPTIDTLKHHLKTHLFK